MKITANELAGINVINPAFTVKTKDVEKAKELIRTGKAICTRRPYYWAMAVKIAYREMK